MKLDNTIEIIANSPGTDLMTTVLEFLIELKKRRKSALRPADKYLSNTPEQQFDHLKFELAEIEVELKNGNVRNLAMEIVDLQMSAETLLAVLPLDEQERNKVRRRVIRKNAKRGYYEQTKKCSRA